MPKIKLWRKKRRKYPVKVDERGRSARRRCFELFPEKIPFHDIARRVDVKLDTVRRYHQQWEKDPSLERRHTYVKGLFKKTAPDRDANIELFARTYGIEKDKFEDILSHPHGIKRLITGRLYLPGQAAMDHNLHIGLELGMLLSDFLVKDGGRYEDVYKALKRLLFEEKTNRREEDAEIKEENRRIQFIKAVLDVEIEHERQGRVKPAVLSEEQRKTYIRLGIEKEKLDTEALYWFKIGVLKGQGLSDEEAREKMYQDLVDKGDLERAKMMREFQDEVHPLKPDNHEPPISHEQPPPSPQQ